MTPQEYAQLFVGHYTRYQINPPLKGKRPDYIGRNWRGEWFVFESKGRSRTIKPGETGEWKPQARAIGSVNGRRVTYNIVSAAYLNPFNEWELLWVDPESAGSDLQVGLDYLHGAYYEEIFQIIRIHQEQLREVQNGFLVPLGIMDTWLGIDRTVLIAVLERDWDALLRFTTSIFEDSKWYCRVDELGVVTFADGLMINFGEKWGVSTSLPSNTPCGEL